MSTISNYIKSLTKCCNIKCKLKTTCLRYSTDARGRFKIRNDKCKYYFRSNANGLENNPLKDLEDLKDFFSFK